MAIPSWLRADRVVPGQAVDPPRGDFALSAPGGTAFGNPSLGDSSRDPSLGKRARSGSAAPIGDLAVGAALVSDAARATMAGGVAAGDAAAGDAAAAGVSESGSGGRSVSERAREVLNPGWWTPIRADAALATGVLAVELMMWVVGPDDWYSYAGAWFPIWTAVTLVPIVVRRVALWPAVAATVALILLGLVVQELWAAQGVALWVLAYSLAAYATWWRAALGSAALWLANDFAFLVAIENGYLNDSNGRALVSFSAGMLINVLMMVVLFLIGRTIQARRLAAKALRERAAAAEQGRHAHAEQAVAEERRRIARELHDVVAHHVSVIGVMATGARRVLKHDYGAAEQALSTIEQTSRTTLRELRRLLFLLRVESEAESELTPQPGLGGIRTLVEQVRDAGLPATLRIEGDASELDPGVALTAYRIVQEALTNALKHAGHASAEVRMTFKPDLLTIEVFDTGSGPRQGMAPGHGLLGMRERVAVYGGTLRTGPRPGGGFRVYAKIPVECPATGAEVEAVA